MHALSDDDKQSIPKGCALIRAAFHIDPGTLSYEEWAALYQQAVWLERRRLRNFAELLGRLFSSDEETGKR